MLDSRFVVMGAITALVCLSCAQRDARRGPAVRPVVRLAELEIDPAQIDGYLGYLREEIETSIRVEPGVLTLYAVRLRSEPNHVRLFEMYADSGAYLSHIASPHFLKYKTGTQAMVKSLVLHETTPFLLGTKRSDILRDYVTVE